MHVNRHNNVVNNQVLLEKNQDRDITGHCLPNLVYVSTQKSTSHLLTISKPVPLMSWCIYIYELYFFKCIYMWIYLYMVCVSAVMTTAPIILTLRL
ncbi:cellulose synthase-like protein G3 [Gossypium australe]|uniref:Cellulose synthase-like protein G3 n=1 Tax=Gossypium australe TaxID=47621 RepID=A0A5B6W4F3_9ROSI|nr:cellulose synthase-like protein G3 [Gossypium australe]